MSKSLLKATASVGSMTMLSRVLGLIRDMVIARLGANVGTDAFFVAFKIPNFMRRLFAEGAFSQGFVPVLSEYKAKRGEAEVGDLVDHVAGTLGGVLFLVTLIGVIAAPVLVLIFAPGFLGEGGKYDLTVVMLRITFPYLLFISLVSLAAGVLNSYGRFGVPAFTPVFLNLCLILAALWFAPRLHQPVIALAWGVFIAGVVQLLFQIPFLARLGFRPRFRWGWGHAGVKRVVTLMIPGIFGSSVAQINLLIDTLVASFLVSGSITWLYYSDRLVEFPLGVFGIALATVMLPKLSQQHAEASPERFSDTLDWALRWVLVIGLPAAVALVVLAGPLLTTLFQYDRFTGTDVAMAARSLMAYAVGLVGFILVKVLAPGFYARQDTRTPVRFAVVAMIANIVLNVVLVFPLAHAGLALATSLASLINAGLLFHRLRADGAYRALPGWPVLGIRVVAANLVMGALLWWSAGELSIWLERDALSRAVHLGQWVGAGAASYFAALWLFGLRPRHLRIR
jgi:putative peptidoglycan lipid II flippase